MEDRHYLSEPRPISDVPTATWEVDIFREGVDTPIMTILVNKTSVPPRKRKKKIVWKLPDTIAQTPKFGMEDKKRILDLYKQQKKIRRQRRSVSNTSSSGSSIGGGGGGRGGQQQDAAVGAANEGGATGDDVDDDDDDYDYDYDDGDGDDGEDEEENVVGVSSSKQPAMRRSQSLSSNDHARDSSGTTTAASIGSSNERTKPNHPKLLRKSQSTGSNGSGSNGSASNPIPLPPPGFSMASLSLSDQTNGAEQTSKVNNGNQKQKNNGNTTFSSSSTTQMDTKKMNRTTNDKTIPKNQQPITSNGKTKKTSTGGGGGGGGTARANNLHKDSVSLPTKVNDDVSAKQGKPALSLSNRSNNHEQLQQQQQQQQQQQPPPPKLSLDENFLPTSPALDRTQKQKQQLNPEQAPPGLTSTIPATPTIPTPINKIVHPTLRQFVVPPTSTLAQVVTETYYLYLGRGLIQELASHYSPTAQKSLTVGSAHAMCHQPNDIVVQLQRLSGMIVHVKGVLQHAPTPTSLQPPLAQSSPPSQHAAATPVMHTSTLIVITGTCVQPHALPFCHSLVLVPSAFPSNDLSSPSTSGCQGYVIQNDALCFLTSDDGGPPVAPTGG